MKKVCWRALPLIYSGLGLFACAAEPEPLETLYVPSPQTFPLVGEALERRCATLDCHGQPARNLRLYGRSGMRLSQGDVPGEGQTTRAEHDASYASVIGLEPEVLSLVVEEGGRLPERLTLVRKARGEEAHKAGARLSRGDDADQCLTSWLAGETEKEACEKAAAEFGPPGE